MNSSVIMIVVSMNACIGRQQPATPQPQIEPRPGPSDTFTCRLQILNKHTPIPMSPKEWGGHIGVDFAVCHDMHIISIGDGDVGFVSPDDTTNSESFYNGGSVIISHIIPGTEIEYLFEYVHLKNITVKAGNHVMKGRVLGDAWTTTKGGWIPHVHLELLDSRRPIEDRDPTRYIKKCQSEAGLNELVYPIPC